MDSGVSDQRLGQGEEEEQDMADRRFDRRRVLKGAAAFGALGALAAVQGPLTARADEMTGIEGTWLSTVTTGGSGPGAFAWHRDAIGLRHHSEKPNSAELGVSHSWTTMPWTEYGRRTERCFAGCQGGACACQRR